MGWARLPLPPLGAGMILAGRSYADIEERLQKRTLKCALLATSIFIFLGAVYSILLWRFPALRALGLWGEREIQLVITNDDRLHDEIEAVAARRVSQGAIRLVEFVFSDEDIQAERPQLTAADLPDPLNAALRSGGPTVSIGELVPFRPPRVEFELDENLSVKSTSRRSAHTQELAILTLVRPDYPDVSLWAEVEGLVRLRATIDPEGKVIAVDILSNEADLYCGEAALVALYDWRFKPVEIDGEAIQFGIIVPFRFKIDIVN